MAFFSQREKSLWLAAGLCLFLIYLSAFIARPLANFLRDHGLLRATVLATFLIAAGLVALLLWRSRRGWRVAAAAVGVGLIYLTLLTLIPMLPEEKLHFLEYGGVGALVYLALKERRQRQSERQPWVSPGLGAVMLTGTAGWLDEGIQAILPDRYYDLRDVAFNTIAALLAVLSVAIIDRCDREANMPSEST